MSKENKTQNQSLKCPLSKETQQNLKELADTVEKHKELIRKLSPFHW